MVFAVGFEIFGDLCCQFARRCQDQRPGHPGAGAAGGQNFDHRQGKGCRFARAGLRAAENIPSHQNDRYRLFLNRSGGFVAGFFDGL